MTNNHTSKMNFKAFTTYLICFYYILQHYSKISYYIGIYNGLFRQAHELICGSCSNFATYALKKTAASKCMLQCMTNFGFRTKCEGVYKSHWKFPRKHMVQMIIVFWVNGLQTALFCCWIILVWVLNYNRAHHHRAKPE